MLAPSELFRLAPGYAISALPRSVVAGEAAVDVDVARLGGDVPLQSAGLRSRPHAFPIRFAHFPSAGQASL